MPTVDISTTPNEFLNDLLDIWDRDPHKKPRMKYIEGSETTWITPHSSLLNGGCQKTTRI